MSMKANKFQVSTSLHTNAVDSENEIESSLPKRPAIIVETTVNIDVGRVFSQQLSSNSYVPYVA